MASDDAVTLLLQTTTFEGGCGDGNPRCSHQLLASMSRQQYSSHNRDNDRKGKRVGLPRPALLPFARFDSLTPAHIRLGVSYAMIRVVLHAPVGR